MKKKLSAKDKRLRAEEEAMLARWGNVQKFARTPPPAKDSSFSYKLTAPAGRPLADGQSRVTPGGSTATVNMQYTGDKILGIAAMHKSSLVPVFSTDQAVDISRMRR